MKRWIIITGVVATLAVAGCSKSEPSASTPTTSSSGGSPTTKAGDAPTTKAGTSTATLSLNDCLAVGMANLGVIGGSKEDADKLKSFNPPEDVKKAIDVLVAAGGLKVTGGEQEKELAASTTITDWVDASCPK
jgi:hypothetical protein